MLIIKHIECIMEGFECDMNTAIQLYKRGTIWED